MVSKTAQSLAQLIFILAASVVFMMLTYGRPGLVIPILLVGACSFGLWPPSTGCRRQASFGMLFALLEAFRVPAQRLQQKRAHLLRLDETIVGFYPSHPKRFYAPTGFYFAGWLLDSLEIWLAAYLLGMPIAWPQAVVVEAFAGISKGVRNVGAGFSRTQEPALSLRWLLGWAARHPQRGLRPHPPGARTHLCRGGDRSTVWLGRVSRTPTLAA